MRGEQPAKLDTLNNRESVDSACTAEVEDGHNEAPHGAAHLRPHQLHGLSHQQLPCLHLTPFLLALHVPCSYPHPGFTHTAFSFAHESGVTNAPVDPNNVAPGTLIALVQKGMQYLELEANVDGQVRSADEAGASNDRQELGGRA
eukprot:727225-Pelagomonas_calceolata.AAC.10